MDSAETNKYHVETRSLALGLFEPDILIKKYKKSKSCTKVKGGIVLRKELYQPNDTSLTPVIIDYRYNSDYTILFCEIIPGSKPAKFVSTSKRYKRTENFSLKIPTKEKYLIIYMNKHNFGYLFNASDIGTILL